MYQKFSVCALHGAHSALYYVVQDFAIFELIGAFGGARQLRRCATSEAPRKDSYMCVHLLNVFSLFQKPDYV